MYCLSQKVFCYREAGERGGSVSAVLERLTFGEGQPDLLFEGSVTPAKCSTALQALM